MGYLIRSYLRLPEGFVPVEACRDSPRNADYIDGAIEWKVGSEEIISLEHWDLVDQLWAYIINGLDHLTHSKDFETTFPDQPLRLRFRRRSSYSIEVTVGDTMRVVPADEFFAALHEGARHFFAEMIRLVPKKRAAWEHEIRRIDELQASRQRR
jgi:hypothetical protein